MVQRPGDPMTTVGKPITYGGHVLFASKAVTICGNHRAVLSHFQMRSKRHASDVDMIDTSWNGEVIRALYFRTVGKIPNIYAERAIRSLCLRKS